MRAARLGQRIPAWVSRLRWIAGGRIEPPLPVSDGDGLDPESARWIADLQGPERGAAVERLRAILDAAARFELARRSAGLADASPSALERMASEATEAALASLLTRLDEYGGGSRFSTWARKFALLEAAAMAQIRSWEGRALPDEGEAWRRLGLAAADETGGERLIAALREAIREDLDAEQRAVLLALAVNGVPIDVLAERLETSRGALYRTLHDARDLIRARLEGQGQEHTIAMAG